MNASLLAAAALAYGVLTAFTITADSVLVYPETLTQEQAAEDGSELPPGTGFEREILPGGIYELKYSFQNFNRDRLSLEFTIVPAELEGSLKEFGWSKKEADAVYQRAPGGPAASKRKVDEYLASRGFRVARGNVVTADVPLLVRRNFRRLNGLAHALAKESQTRGYSSEEVVGAAAALVQTALAYKIPPAVENGVHTGGIHTPPKALVDGWGDCDTKTVLLASLLANWSGMRMVGISLPRHYLMGVARIPRQGDVYVEYNGSQYVLIEAAGPGWLLPGTVSAETQDLLDSVNNVPIEML